jgi:hypothetical protein
MMTRGKDPWKMIRLFGNQVADFSLQIVGIFLVTQVSGNLRGIVLPKKEGDHGKERNPK